MKNNKLMLTAALAGLTMTMGASDAFAGKAGYEKCKTVAPKGANSCGANGHACGGFGQSDWDKEEWVYVKEGHCAKIKSLISSNPELKEFLKSVSKNARKYKRNFKKGKDAS